MTLKRYIRQLVAFSCVLLLTGCGNHTVLSSADTNLVQTDISTLTVPENVQIVGLGEASHGAHEYQTLKADVFKALVENNGCRTFIIEGDFGGALKVDAYIHGGDGTAEEAVGSIGFAIYRTEEMADLVSWMRTYNETVPEGADLHFYGMDMQRYDSSKEYLFSVLNRAAPELLEKYKTAFSALTDENRWSLSANDLEKGKEAAQELIKELDAAENTISGALAQDEFALAKECLNSIYEYCQLQAAADADYNVLRDQYMSEKVDWFLQHGPGGVLFINGHNGHIGKASTAGYTCLGELLDSSYGEAYFAIGTDAQTTTFNSQNDNGEFDVMKVSNSNDLNSQLDPTAYYYLDFSRADTDAWKEILSKEQRITALNVGIAEWQKLSKGFYTAVIVPKDTFDGMIVFGQVSPTAIITSE